MSIKNKVDYLEIKKMSESLSFKFERIGESTTVVCYAFLPSGFTVGKGDSACVDPKEFKLETGKKYAKERALQDATNKLWELEGYLLMVTGKTSGDF